MARSRRPSLAGRPGRRTGRTGVEQRSSYASGDLPFCEDEKLLLAKNSAPLSQIRQGGGSSCARRLIPVAHEFMRGSRVRRRSPSSSVTKKGAERALFAFSLIAA